MEKLHLLGLYCTVGTPGQIIPLLQHGLVSIDSDFSHLQKNNRILPKYWSLSKQRWTLTDVFEIAEGP